MFPALGLPWIYESIHHLANGNHQHIQNSCSSKVFFRICLNLCMSEDFLDQIKENTMVTNISNKGVFSLYRESKASSKWTVYKQRLCEKW